MTRHASHKNCAPGRVLEFYLCSVNTVNRMKYSKTPLTFAEQISSLKKRGLFVADENKALHYLSNISFYRLRAFTYPFQDNQNPSHPFIKKVSFEEVIALYVFDRRLRLLIFNALEKIEISLRTKIIYHYSHEFGNQFYENQELFRNSERFRTDHQKLLVEMKRSSEDFIRHYYKKYTTPLHPPAWMSLEVASMGWLSQFYKNLKRSDTKRKIALNIGLPKEDFLENWMHVFTNLRNNCAHHSRIWNRRFVVEPMLPKNTTYQFITNRRIHTNKLYAALCCIQYINNQISPESSFRKHLLQLMNSCPMNQQIEMGFPENWLTEKLWNE